MFIDRSRLPTPELTRLFHNRRLTEVPDSLKNSSFALRLAVTYIDTNRDTRKYILPRIAVSELISYYNLARSEWSYQTCHFISTLYASGLGLPKDTILASYWATFAHKEMPVVDGVDIEYGTLINALKVHVRQAKNNSLDGKHAYLELAVEHYSNLSKPLDLISKDAYCPSLRLSKSPLVITPNVKGLNTVLTYRRDGDKYILYAAFVKYRGKNVPITAQAFNSKQIQNTVNLKLKSQYVTIVGRITYDDSQHVIPYADEHNLETALKHLLERDYDTKKDTAPTYCSTLIDSEGKRKFSYFTKYLEHAKKAQAKGTVLGPETRKRLKKAMAFVKSYKLAVKRKSDSKDWLSKSDVLDNIYFYAMDIVAGRSDSTHKLPKADYSLFMKQFKLAGFNTLPYALIKASEAKNVKLLRKTVNKLLLDDHLESIGYRIRLTSDTKIGAVGETLWVTGKHDS